MIMDDEPTLYRFKWSNYNMDRYAESSRARATMLRREARNPAASRGSNR